MTLEDRARELLATQDRWQGILLDIRPEQVIAEAIAADRRGARGQRLSAVDGRFLAVKANIDLGGLRSHAGSRAYRPCPATSDAPVVTRLRAAGAIVIGHANMSEFAFSGLGLNPHFGTPTNALDSRLVPGGSSSGSATAVAMGFADIALGTDTSGSLRVPAACQGIVGFRPSMGRYPSSGIVPLAPSLDTPGPLASDVRSLQAMDHLMSGKHDAGGVCDHLLCLDEASLEDYAPDLADMYRAVLHRLANTTLTVSRCSIQSFRQVTELFQTQGTLVAVEAAEHLPVMAKARSHQLDPHIRRRLEHSARIGASSRGVLHGSRQVLSAAFAAELGEAMLLYPTLQTSPPHLTAVSADLDRFAEENARILKNSMFAAYLDAPTVSLPFDPVMPGMSVSLTAANGRDADVLATAAKLEAIFQPNPPETHG